jgi:DNA-binding transcriptional ArsR family regulator
MMTPPAVAFEALADPTRREVVELLASGPRRAGELSSTVGVSAPAMSRHLRILLDAGLIVDERTREDARLRVFRLRPEGLSGLDSWLGELKSRWGEQLRSFQHYAQERGRQ